MAPSIAVYSTDDFPLRQRVRAWNEWSSATIAPSRIDPTDRDTFCGRLRILELNSLRFANFISAPATLSHTRAHVSARDDHAMILHLQLRGESLNTQDGRQTLIRAGDYTLCDSSRPYGLAFDSLNDMLSLRIPHKIFRERIPAPEALICLHMPGNAGISSLVSQLIRSCWLQYLQGADPLTGTRLAENMLDLLATSYSVACGYTPGDSCVTRSRRLLIRRYIEDNLHDPELSIAKLAAAFRCTPAYLHKLFRLEGESVWRYILKRRLECAARLIRDPLFRGVQLNDIAFRLGFKSATHFGRVFKERFGLTPGEFRHSAGESLQKS